MLPILMRIRFHGGAAKGLVLLQQAFAQCKQDSLGSICFEVSFTCRKLSRSAYLVVRKIEKESSSAPKPVAIYLGCDITIFSDFSQSFFTEVHRVLVLQRRALRIISRLGERIISRKGLYVGC